LPYRFKSGTERESGKMGESNYRTADHVVALGVVHTNNTEGDWMGTQTAEEFFDSSMFPLWERTPYADFRCPDGLVETYQLDVSN
jgi:hypothetical protein